MAQIQNLTAVPATPSGALHPIAPSRLHGVKGRPDMVAVGTWIWLASELMFFAALFAVYFSMKNVTTAMTAPGAETMWHWGSEHFMNDWFGFHFPWFSMANTIILVLSSVTCQMGVWKAEHGIVGRTGSIFNVKSWGLREWYTLTFLMGAFFIGGQAFEYSNLAAEGFIPSTNSYSSAFFVATGIHGLHVLGGLIAFLLMLGRTYLARTFTHEQAVHAIVTSYYWHFVDLVWIILFSVIYIIR